MLDEEFENKVEELITTFLENFVTYKYDKYDNKEKIVNPMAVKTFFFNTIAEDISFNPIYDAKDMNKYFLAFQYLIDKINLYICPYPADLKDFCKMANITNEKLIDYRDNGGQEMNIVIEKLYDYCRDSNLLLGQSKLFSASITSLKAKSELEIKENRTPNVNINITEKVPLEKINERLKIIRNFEKKSLENKNAK